MAVLDGSIQILQHTTAEWATAATLLDGQPGHDTDTGEMAIGDGSTAWAGLNKFIPGATTLTSLGVSAFAQTLLDDADASAFLGTLGFSANGKSLVGAANYAAMRALLDLEAGTDFNAYSSVLNQFATLGVPGFRSFPRGNTDGSFAWRTYAQTIADLGAGAPDGLATLDSSGYIPTSQLPASIVGQVEYQGAWSASANSPAIPAAASGNKGHYYMASTAVASSHGYSNVPAVDFAVGDWIISDGTAWTKIDNTDAVAMVAGRTGNIVLTSADLTDRTTLGGNWFTMATPGGVRFARINSDGTITQRTAAQLVTDLALTIGSNTQAWDADLDAIAALTPTNDDVIQRKAGAWVNRTMGQLKVDLSLSGTNTGDQTITLTGPITGSGTGSIATTIADAELAAIAALTSAADKIAQFTGSGTAALVDLKLGTDAAYGGTITWTAGANPSGTANLRQFYTRVGNLVTWQISLTYATTGTTITNVALTFPTEFPTPAIPTGFTGASVRLYSCGHTRLLSTPTGALTNGAGFFIIRNAADTGFEIASTATFPSGSYRTFIFSGSYFAA